MGTRFAAALAAAVILCAPDVGAAETWIEVKSAHFTVISNAGEGSTRTLLGQLEQVRSAMAKLWSWARVDLNKPLLVIAVKNETSMKAMAPKYWEDRGGVRPASVWVTGPDRHYLTIRTDLEVETQGGVNAHISAYFSYINLVMNQSLSPNLPLWVNRGLTGVLSNTLVRDDHVIVGAPIPWHLERLREGTRLPLEKLLTITRASRDFQHAEGLELFDAQAWAFVHFLMLGDTGARAEKLNAFAQLVSTGTDPSAAFRETLGSPESLATPFRIYFDRKIFQVLRVNTDVRLDRQRFPVRTLPPAESASAQALFHLAMRRGNEARRAIAEARKANPENPGSYEAEGLLLDFEGKRDEARLALERAVDAGSSNGHVHYRLASLIWKPDADRDTLAAVEKHLSTATRLNNRDARAYSWLGEIRSLAGTGEAAGLVMRAVALEPWEAGHRLRAARVLGREKKYPEAEAQAKEALNLSETDDDRRRAQALLDWISKAKPPAEEKQPPSR